MNGILPAFFGVVVLASSALVTDVPRAPETGAQQKGERLPRTHLCFNSAETREKIVSRRLGEPFHLLRAVTGRAVGETLRAKLCRWNEDYIYDIAILRRDGRIVHVYLNAVSGQTVSGDHN